MSRPWLALLLVSCTRVNPLFLDGEGASGTIAESSSSSSSSSTTAVSSTVEPTTGSTEAPVPETSSSATTAVGPLCGEFPGDPLDLNPEVSQSQCESVQTVFVAVNAVAQSVELQLCLDAGCNELLCLPDVVVTLPQEVAPLFTPGSCLKAKHEGVWVDAGDPEVPKRCKTTGLAIYDNATIYPLYAASSRVFHAPSFLDPDVRMDVTRAADAACTCAADDCCLDGQAETFGLTFSYQGQALGTYPVGGSFQPQLKEALYSATVLRAHAKGYFSTATMTCVDEPETPYVEWAMFRVIGPP